MPYITPELRLCLMVCFTTKRNYTTLKLAESIPDSPEVLLPKEITLLSNNLRTLFAPCTGFTTKRNYTTLKLRKRLFSLSKCFTTKRNYTTLKRCKIRCFNTHRFYYQKKLHYSQTPYHGAQLVHSGFTTKRNYTTLKRCN